MAAKDTNLKKHSGANVVYRFLGGTVAGTFVIFILYWFSPVEIDFFHIGIALLLVILCGLMSSVFGIKFIDALMNLAGSSGL